MSLQEKEAIAKHLRCLYGTRAGKDKNAEAKENCKHEQKPILLNGDN